MQSRSSLHYNIIWVYMNCHHKNTAGRMSSKQGILPSQSSEVWMLVDSVSGDDLIPGFRWRSLTVSFLCREVDELWSCLGFLNKDKNSVLGDFTLLSLRLPQNSTSWRHHSGTRILEFPRLFGGHTNILSQVSQGSMTEWGQFTQEERILSAPYISLQPLPDSSSVWHYLWKGNQANRKNSGKSN